MKVEVLDIQGLDKVSKLCKVFFGHIPDNKFSFLDDAEIGIGESESAPVLLINCTRCTAFDTSRRPLTYKAILRKDCRIENIRLINNKSVLQISANVTDGDETYRMIMSFNVNHIGDSNDVELFIQDLN